jgi:sn-glycerol 3-phosphate transport system substrate-binding protein
MRRAVVLVLLSLVAAGLSAQPVSVEFWHAMGGKNGEMTAAICEKFSASQPEYRVTAVYKGSYPDTMNAGVAAFRAGSPPAILQVFEVGTATMMAAKGAIKPVFQLMV